MWDSKIIEPWLKELINKAEPLGILCLSENKDDILMWSHYANSHTGFCLIFNKTALNSQLGYCKPIDYREELPKLNEYLNLSSAERAELFLLTKSDHWKYEKEWRIIIRLRDPNIRDINLPKGILSGIILGCKMPNENRNRIKKRLHRQHQNIKIYQADMSSNDYSLVRKNILDVDNSEQG